MCFANQNLIFHFEKLVSKAKLSWNTFVVNEKENTNLVSQESIFRDDSDKCWSLIRALLQVFNRNATTTRG